MIAGKVGRIIAVRSHALEATLPAARLKEIVRITTRCGFVVARIDAIGANSVHLTPADETRGIAAGDRVESRWSLPQSLGLSSLGCVVDPAEHWDVLARPFARAPIDQPLWTRIGTIDGLLTIGRGARIGIFGPPGTGKTTLLEQIARSAAADAIVVGLIGERGREAEHWKRALDVRTTIVCATSDRNAAQRMRAAELAFAQAEALRDRGLHVLLILDSLARVAAGAREIAIALGEPPGRGGYPPSVFPMLAQLVERAGNAREGSITLIATVLSEGMEGDDPVGVAVRSLVDGHFVLEASLAGAGLFPAIDVPRSISRTMADVVTKAHNNAARAARGALARLSETADLRAAGIQGKGEDPGLDRAVAALPALEAFLYGGGSVSPRQTLDQMLAIADSL